MNRIKLAPHPSVEELKQRYRRTAEPTERSRWQIIWLLSTDQWAREVAESTGYFRLLDRPDRAALQHGRASGDGQSPPYHQPPRGAAAD